MKIHPASDSDKFRLVEAGPNSFSIYENPKSAIIVPKDFNSMLINLSVKENLFDAIFKILEKGKEVTVSFGSPTTKTNYFAVELAASSTVDYFDHKYGVFIEVTKDKDTNLASFVIFKKVGDRQNCETDLIHDSNDSGNTGGGLLDIDEKDNEPQKKFKHHGT